ncbi:unnamed protein product [Cyclocybe aegerita]|uniref:Protein kinase domain-containing protein n=1 Tax=Cyclocybe aegerita TaxID=1973307 RepID=A0A8S0VZL6_CYCAE|nr:unnamed protein product [Cyclocybe aegerita]
MNSCKDYSKLPVEEGGLSPGEKFWRKHYEWLQSKGYQLRPRFSPDWVPSWVSTKKYYMFCEDGPALMPGQVIDAIYTPDGSSVALKRTDKSYHPYEEEIFRYLSSEPLSSDPRNHCAPLLDVLYPPEDSRNIILVMPMLRRFDSPPFDTFGEALECFRQLFEGLQFMHEHHVAHRDINGNNFMMHGVHLFPEKYHFVHDVLKPDLSGRAPHLTRSERPTKYYITDFGISSRYESDSRTSALEPVIIGGDKSVPEFKDITIPQNPFRTDVYYAGNVIRQHFIEGHSKLTWIRGYYGFDFLKPLINDMVQEDPAKRPTMDEVVKRFDAIVKGLSGWKLRSRVVPRRGNVITDVGRSIAHWRRKVQFILKGTPAIPRPS